MCKNKFSELLLVFMKPTVLLIFSAIIWWRRWKLLIIFHCEHLVLHQYDKLRLSWKKVIRWSGEIMAIFIRNENYVNFDLFWPDQVVNLFIPDFLNFLNINRITKGVWGNQSYKGCGSKSVYFQRIASTWKYTDLFPHPLIKELKTNIVNIKIM